MHYKYVFTKLSSSLLALGLTLSCASAWAQDFFRYKDDSGTLVLSHTIPVDRVRFGYDIVDENGRVKRRVAPQLSEEEYQAKVAREKAVAECENALRRVNKAYQTLDDIDLAEEQELRNIDTSIANARANLQHAQNQRKKLEGQAAQRDLEGKSIPNELLNNIERARSQEKTLSDEIDFRLAEKLDQRIHYRYDRKIFELNSCEKGLPPRGGG